MVPCGSPLYLLEKAEIVLVEPNGTLSILNFKIFAEIVLVESNGTSGILNFKIFAATVSSLK